MALGVSGWEQARREVQSLCRLENRTDAMNVYARSESTRNQIPRSIWGCALSGMDAVSAACLTRRAEALY